MKIFQDCLNPSKIKMVEKITFHPRDKRKELIEKTGYNVFMLKAEDVS